MDASLTGKLLVASPLLDDPNFARGVVLVCSHDAQGTFGVLLNRPLATAVTHALPRWSVPLASPPVVFGGGPVDTSVLFALGRGDGLGAEAWSLPVLPGVGVLDLARLDDAVAAGLQHARVFAGYAGWGAGQFEAELAGDAWFVVDAIADDVFTAHPERAWHAVLRRQTGALAMYAFFPDDPAVN